MIKSMTGYGSSKGTADGLELSIELKSVNNRYLDTSVRMPRSFIFAEDTVKSVIQRHISRGKVDVFITVTSAMAENVVVTVNGVLAESYIKALKSLSEKYGITDEISNVNIGRFQDVLVTEKREADREAVAAGICTILEEALCEFDAMRAREGERLREDMLQHLCEIEQLVAFVETRSPQTVSDYRARLEQKMREVLESASVDESRLLTEAAIFADKVAVDEETVRLHSHIAQLRDMLMGESPVGRKLDFLIQEFNREANTIGSKCNDVEIAKAVVDLKSEIEKLREQLQNIE
jgi:uncharacterized protein (TIGR00255 family)